MQRIENSEAVLDKILTSTSKLSKFHDLDSVLDQILYDARLFSRADAGSIYLVENDQLVFNYVHNDTLFKPGKTTTYLYKENTIELNHQSIAGHVACSMEPLTLKDVHQLPENVTYTFNTDFDKATGYHTQSMLTVPLISSQKKVIGVMTLINAKDEKGQIVEFCEHDELFVSTLAYHATVAIERTVMNREMILRMLATSRLRDPMETGPHVNRVGAYSAEIYQRWANKKGLPWAEMKKKRDTLRLAAMLHDIGKVAISDLILKKPGKLTTEEFAIMKTHTIYGARLFSEGKTELDTMSSDIALGHHERWDGNGYPGHVRDFKRDPITMGNGKKGEEISIYGAIVAVADVYDALSARRVYKEPWPQEQVLEEIQSSSGTQFHPDVVETFMEIYDVIDAIRLKYKDE